MDKIMNFRGTVLKNLFSKPVTKNYPAEPAVYPERSRGHIEITIEDCILCGLCSMNCPPRAIAVDRAGSKWSINRFDCVQCGYCVEKCPKKCLTILPGYQEPMPEKAVAVYEKPVQVKKFPQADTDVCVYCTLCAKKCPKEAILVDRAEKKWELNKDLCVSCGLCESSCPKKCISMVPEN
jgi:formate hydrogenlyase subunit 6/NADH:ubiquinone oxidoreductase subunit I